MQTPESCALPARLPLAMCVLPPPSSPKCGNSFDADDDERIPAAETNNDIVTSKPGFAKGIVDMHCGTDGDDCLPCQLAFR